MTTAGALAAQLRAFVVDTLEYLHKGGRIGGAKRLVGSVLSIKPVLHLEDGKIEPLASIRTKTKAIEHMLDVVLGEMKGKKDVHAGVIHAAAPDDALLERVVERLECRFGHALVGDVVALDEGTGNGAFVGNDRQ